jgi:hypothetical protein
METDVSSNDKLAALIADGMRRRMVGVMRGISGRGQAFDTVQGAKVD